MRSFRENDFNGALRYNGTVFLEFRNYLSTSGEVKIKSLTQEENRPNSNDVKGDVQVCGHSVAD